MIVSITNLWSWSAVVEELTVFKKRSEPLK